MNKMLWTALIIVILLAFAPLSSIYAQNSGVTINGIIYNGTQGGELSEGLLVSLYVYTDGSITGQYNTTADSAGVFTFQQVDLMGGEEVVAYTDYAGGVYSAESFVYDPDGEIPDLTIEVYESTEDSSDVVISQLTFMLNASDGQLRVGEYYILSNTSDKTWIGSFDEGLGFNRTIEFSIPSDAETLWFSGYGLDMRFFSVEGGFVDTVPVGPGDPYSEIFFSYAVPFTGIYEMTKTLNLPVESVEYLVAQDSGITLEGNGISYTEVIQTDTDAANSYGSPGFDAGQTLSFTVIESSGVFSGSGIGLEVGIGLAVLALSGLGIYWVMKGGEKAALPANAEPLLVEIASLDDAYAAGNLKKAQYQKKRNALLEKVKKLEK